VAKYLIEETISSQAAAGAMQKPEDRFEVLKPICEAAGCKLEQFYVSGIENKSYLIIESPDLKSVCTIGTNFLASGAASAVKYIPLLTVPEAVDLFRRAASLGYRPPGR
jgi:hypothetical protein